MFSIIASAVLSQDSVFCRNFVLMESARGVTKKWNSTVVATCTCTMYGLGLPVIMWPFGSTCDYELGRLKGFLVKLTFCLFLQLLFEGVSIVSTPWQLIDNHQLRLPINIFLLLLTSMETFLPSLIFVTYADLPVTRFHVL